MADDVGKDDPNAPKCPVCGEAAHARPLVYEGNNKRGDITGNLRAENALGITDFDNYIFYRGESAPQNRGIDAERIPPEGHHLITIEAVEDTDWEKIFKAFGYDINCAQNGVMLPGDMWVACHFGVPRHKGSHKATFGDKIIIDDETYINMTYVESITDILEKERPTIESKCKTNDIKGFHDLMLEHSQNIFNKIMNFTWTISSDGYDYPKAGIVSAALGGLGIGTGCYKRCTSLTKKVAKKITDGGLSIASGTIARDKHQQARHITDQGVCNRDHSDDGCKPISEVLIESKYRHNVPDPNIT